MTSCSAVTPTEARFAFPFWALLSFLQWARKYVEGWFRLGRLQLYVNRGIGTVGVPFRFDCPPEITVITLRAGE